MARRDPNRQYVIDAWREAKAAEPSLTQAEFARRTFPAYRRKGETYVRKMESGARQLRRILSDFDSERMSDKAVNRLVRQSRTGTRVATVEFSDFRGTQTVGYANVLLPEGTSTFDAFRLQRTPEGRRLGRRLGQGRLLSSPPYGVKITRRMKQGARVTAVRPVKVSDAPTYVGVFNERDE